MATIEEALTIEVNHARIAGTLITPGTLVPGVLFIPGWGGSQAQTLALTREVAALGCLCLTFDLRGHAEGRREFETVTRADQLQDVLAACDTLVQRRHSYREAARDARSLTYRCIEGADHGPTSDSDPRDHATTRRSCCPG